MTSLFSGPPSREAVAPWALAQALTPKPQADAGVEQLADSVPQQFGEWKAMLDATVQAELATAGDGGKNMLASGKGRLEPATYWARIGDAYPQGRLAMRMKIFRDGLKGKVNDGMLVQSSMMVGSSAEVADAYVVQEGFLRQRVAASDARGKALIVRTPEVRP